MKNKHKIWGDAGWPWEMELLALVFVVLALAVPLYLNVQEQPDPETIPIAQRIAQQRISESGATMADSRAFFWGIVIVGLYLVHLLMAYSATDAISTPFVHLFSPLAFAIIAYARLLSLSDGSVAPIVAGTPQEMAAWILAVLLVTAVVARIRMARHFARFREIDWDLVCNSRFDGTFLKDLIVTFRPLVYPPRKFRVSPEGILIEGWLYVYPIPFSAIKAVESVRRLNFASAGLFFATSSKALVRIQPTETKTPIFISPDDRDDFIACCNGYLNRGVVSLARDDSDDEE
jgi:hypothetical protein